MYQTPIVLFGVQSALTAFLWLLVRHRSNVPVGLQYVVLIAYLTTPIYILIKGSQSAIYASDFLVPILLVAFFFDSRYRAAFSEPPVIVLACLLVVLPAFVEAAYILSAGGEIAVGDRSMKADAVWMYRNVLYVLVFSFSLSTQLNPDQFLAFCRLNLWMALALGLQGCLHYFGPYNLAIFERYTIARWNEEGYEATRIGLGFFGLYRASVGQWFASIVILGAGTIFAFRKSFRFVALAVCILGVGMILLSYSRAGFVGLVFGLAFLGFGSKSGKQRIAVLVAGTIVGLWFLFAGDIFVDRVQSIVSGESSNHGREAAWWRAVEFFLSNPSAILWGVGPTNREAVFKITGAYGAHNEYIDAVFRLGILGLILIFVFIVTLSARIAMTARSAPAIVKSLVTTMLAVFWLNSVVGITQDHLLHDYASHSMGLYLYLLYGVFAGARLNGAKLHRVVPARLFSS